MEKHGICISTEAATKVKRELEGKVDEALIKEIDVLSSGDLVFQPIQKTVKPLVSVYPFHFVKAES